MAQVDHQVESVPQFGKCPLSFSPHFSLQTHSLASSKGGWGKEGCDEIVVRCAVVQKLGFSLQPFYGQLQFSLIVSV